MYYPRWPQHHLSFESLLLAFVLSDNYCLSDSSGHEARLWLAWLSVMLSLVLRPPHWSEKEARKAATETSLKLKSIEIRTASEKHETGRNQQGKSWSFLLSVKRGKGFIGGILHSVTHLFFLKNCTQSVM